MDALVTWAAPNPADGVFEVHLYQGYNPGDYILQVTVPMPATSYLFTGLNDYRTSYFVGAAFNGLESDLTQEVSKRITHRLTIRQR